MFDEQIYFDKYNKMLNTPINQAIARHELQVYWDYCGWKDYQNSVYNSYEDYKEVNNAKR